MKKVIARFPAHRRQTTAILGVTLAALFVFIALLQLLGFEKMPGIIGTFWPMRLDESSLLVAAVVVIFEVFSVPFLLGMSLSPLMRIVSAAFSVLTVLYWLAAAVYSWLANVTDFTTGLTGSYIQLPGGSWLVWFMIGVAALLAWYIVCAYHDAHLRQKRK